MVKKKPLHIVKAEQLPLPQIPDIVWPELNVAKWADFIFIPSHANNARDARKKNWKVEDDGTKRFAHILIEPLSGYSTPTTSTWLVLLALFHLWHERRESDGGVTFSYKEIAQMLGWKWAGKKTTNDLKMHLKILRFTAFTWRMSFVDDQSRKVEFHDHVNLLRVYSAVDWEEKTRSERFDLQNRSHIRFWEAIERNLHASKTKPLQLNVLRSLRGEMARQLYMRLDIIMADLERTRYERRSETLFSDDLQSTSERYKKRNIRKTRLLELIEQLDGQRLSTGQKLRLRWYPTNDGEDYKLVATREAYAIPRQKRRLLVVNDQQAVEILVSDIAAAIGSLDTHRSLYEQFARHYPHQMILQAISEYKADGDEHVKSPRRFFTAIVHRLAHQHKMEWLKACGASCKFRPGNTLI